MKLKNVGYILTDKFGGISFEYTLTTFSVRTFAVLTLSTTTCSDWKRSNDGPVKRSCRGDLSGSESSFKPSGKLGFVGARELRIWPKCRNTENLQNFGQKSAVTELKSVKKLTWS